MRSDFSYRPPRRSGNRLLLALITFGVLAVFAADMLSGGVLRSLVKRGTSLFSGASGNAAAAVSSSGALSTRGALARENDALQARVVQLEQDVAELRSLKEENESLASLVSLARDQRGITAPIMSSFRSSPYGTFLIGVGHEGGIAPGDIVLSTGGFVIGVVSDVGVEVSTVTELFAPGAKLDVTIRGIGAQSVGQGSGNARITLPREIELAPGDTVLAPQYGRSVGIVGRIIGDPSSATQEVFVRIPVNLSSLRHVFIVRG